LWRAEASQRKKEEEKENADPLESAGSPKVS